MRRHVRAQRAVTSAQKTIDCQDCTVEEAAIKLLHGLSRPDTAGEFGKRYKLSGAHNYFMLVGLFRHAQLPALFLTIEIDQTAAQKVLEPDKEALV